MTSTGSRRRRHLVRWVVVGLLGSVMVVAGVLVVPYIFREHPGPESVGRAVEDFRRSSGSSIPGVSSERSPTAGVYELLGAGHERISFPPNSQADGATMPASVEHLPGDCFWWRVDYNVAHWQQEEMCHHAGDLVIRAFSNFQRWDFGTLTVENTSRFTCHAPLRYALGAANGTVTVGSCTGVNTAVSGQTTITTRLQVVGKERLRLGGTVVATVHVRQRDQAAGAQSGAETLDWWFEPRTGLPVRVERAYRLESASPVGTVTYTEEGQGQLASLEPRR